MTRVCIAVWDANPRLPVRADPDDLAESGRGLLLVESLAAQWDACPTPQPGGKIVRAICLESRSAGLIPGPAATSRGRTARPAPLPPRFLLAARPDLLPASGQPDDPYGTLTPGRALSALMAELTSRGLPPTGIGMNLTRLQGTLILPCGLAVGYRCGWLVWPAGRPSRRGRPLHTLHNALDPAGAARRLAAEPVTSS
jgi:hypothetical protein